MIKTKIFREIISILVFSIFIAVVITGCNNSSNKPIKLNKPDSISVDTGNSSVKIQIQRNGMMNNANGMLGQRMMRNGIMEQGMQGQGISGNNSMVWKEPAGINQLKNPIKDIAAAAKAGKNIFTTQCAACHGNDAKGDGLAGKMLNPKPADLTSDSVQTQSNGALFWKITNGKPPMPGFNGILNSNQRWEIIEYLRSLKHD